jgi:hypothetical protein
VIEKECYHSASILVRNSSLTIWKIHANGTRMMNANYENSSNQYQASVSIEI